MNIGAVVDGKYRIERTLSQRRDSGVFSARGIADGQEVVLKVLPATLGGQRLVARFARAQSIQSAHVVRYLAIGDLPDQRPFIVLERLSGPSLSERLRRGMLDISEAVDCILEASDAVAAAHAVGIAHRNLTTENLMLDDSSGRPVVKVLGFVSSVRSPSAEEAQSAPDENVAVEYLAPEQVTHPARADRRCDHWALGVILFELLTRKLPFSAMIRKTILRRILEDAPPAPRSLRADVPWPLEQAILRSLEKSPAQRWESLADLAEALAPFASVRAGALPAHIAKICAPMRKSRAPAALVEAPLPTTAAARRVQAIDAGEAPTTLTLTPPPSSVEQDGEIGFRRMTADGRIEALDSDAVAHLTRARRVAETSAALAREAEANPAVDQSNADVPGEEDEIRAFSRPPPPSSAAPSLWSSSSPMHPTPHSSMSSARPDDPGSRAVEAQKRVKRRARRKAELVRTIALAVVLALLVGLLVGLAIVLVRRGGLGPADPAPPSSVP